MRRGAGIANIQKRQQKLAAFQEKKAELNETELKQLSSQLAMFKGNLEEFAIKHKEQIRKSPQFRAQFETRSIVVVSSNEKHDKAGFHKMCSSVGVDPLVSSKGFWSEALGVGHFYYEIAVQVVEICMATQPVNGGLIQLTDVANRLRQTAGGSRKDLDEADILTAVKKMRSLGSGFRVIELDGDDGPRRRPAKSKRYMIQSTPLELGNDDGLVLGLADDNGGHLSPSELSTKTGWPTERVSRILDSVVSHGLAWLDNQAPETTYWFPAMFLSAS